MLTNPMGETRTTTRNPRRRAAYALVFAALCASLVTAIAIPSAGASKAKVIGHTKHTPPPACPNKKHPKRCLGIGRVTGFMKVADGKKNPFRVPRDGKLVAWAVDASRPTKEQKNVFGELFENKKFGKKPTGRIAVLKHTGKLSYKLLRQSPTVDLSSVLGQKTIITLKKPLTVRKGNLVAFTSPTWTPNFQQRHLSDKDDRWRASRKRSNCSPKGNPPTSRQIHRFARNSHPQQKVGSTRDYECLYTHGRILYWAYYVPNKK